MTTVNEAVATYLAAWNETDAARRAALVARTWTEDGSYLDAHRGGTGHAAISEMIGQVQARFPGYSFRLASGIDAHEGGARFTWHAGGAPQAPLFFAGTDFAMQGPDGRFARVVGFTDAMPHLG